MAAPAMPFKTTANRCTSWRETKFFNRFTVLSALRRARGRRSPISKGPATSLPPTISHPVDDDPVIGAFFRLCKTQEAMQDNRSHDENQLELFAHIVIAATTISSKSSGGHRLTQGTVNRQRHRLPWGAALAVSVRR